MTNAKTQLDLVIQKGHTTKVESIFFGPKGKFLVSTAGDWIIKLWEVQSGQLVRNFAGHSNNVTDAAISHNRKYLATASWDNSVRLWDIESGNQLQELNYPSDSLCFSPDDQYLITGGFDGTARLWEVEKWLTGEAVNPLLQFSDRDHANLNPSNKIKAVNIYDAGERKYLATGSKYGTAKLWNLKTGELLQTYTAHPEHINKDFQLQFWQSHPLCIRSVCFTPDGKYLVTGSNDGTARLWDIEDRQRKTPVHTIYHSDELRSMSVIPEDYFLEKEPYGYQNNGKYKIRSVSLSPDGRFLATAGNDNTAKLWDLQQLDQKEPVSTFAGGHTHPLTAVHISPDGKYLATGSVDTLVQLWDIKTAENIQTFTGESQVVNAAAMSHNGKYLAVGHKDNTVKLWDLKIGELSKTLLSSNAKWDFQGFIWGVSSLDFSQDDEYLLSGSTDRNVKLWQIETGKSILRDIKCDYLINSVALSQDNQWMATGGFDQTVDVWNRATEALEFSFNIDTGWVAAVDLNAEKGYLAVAIDDHANHKINRIDLWDVNTRERLYKFQGHTARMRSLKISKDGKYMVSGSNDNTARVWDLENPDKAPLVLQGHSAWVISVDLSADGAYVVSGSDDGTAKSWDGRSGELLNTFNGHKAGVNVSITDNAKYLVTGSKDSSAKIWGVNSGKELATLISVGAKDWAVITPSGLFDGSPGAMLKMHYSTGMEIIDLDQLKERYYEPGILSKIMGGAEMHIRKVPPLNTVPLYPELIKYEIVDHHLQIALQERNGGLGKVCLYINNKEVKAYENTEGKAVMSINLGAFKPYFLPGEDENIIGIRLYNKEGSVKSPMHALNYTAPEVKASKGWGDVDVEEFEKEKLPDPWLHAIIVGTSDYKGIDLDLSFPDQDATRLAKALSVVGKQSFGDRLDIQLFTSTTNEADKFSSKKNIEAAFAKLSGKAQPQDIVFIYFSGHGANYTENQEAQFHYLTYEIGSFSLDDPNVRATGTISTAELTKWLNKIPAQKEVLIFDTCYSGKVLDGLTVGKKSLDSTQERALDLMQCKTGMYVLAGSSSDKVSFESSRYGQGLLTYSLLWGMTDAALPRDSKDRAIVDIMILFLYSQSQVPKLAESIEQVQEPVVAFPYRDQKFGSFSIGMVDADAQDAIQVKQPKPVIIPSIFLDSDQFEDHLKLSRAVDSFFMDIAARKKNAPLMFIHQHGFSNAWKVRGLYQVNKQGEYNIQVKVYQDKTLESDFNLTGKNITGLVNTIGKRILALIVPESEL